MAVPTFLQKFFFGSYLNVHTHSRDKYPYTHPQSRRRPLFLYAPNAAISGNQAKGVAAVAVVLGSETAEVLATQSLSTRGTRAFEPAKHEHSLRQ